MAHRGKLFHAVQNYFRDKRFKAFLNVLDQVLDRQDKVTILDVGGSPVYWNMLPDRYCDRVNIHCLNFAKEFKKYDGLKSGINLKNVIGNGCDMPHFQDGQFDIVHSNSVIEHVGSLQNMARFASETRRVGNAYYVQTPNYWFPLEPHYVFPFIHWMPDVVKVFIFTHLSLGYAKKCDFETALVRIDHTRMLSAHMMRNFYPDADIKFERVLLLAKSITAIREVSPKPQV